MPEGPEAHVMAHELNQLIQSYWLLNINILDHRHVKNMHNVVFPDRVLQVYAIGKRPIIQTTNGYLMTFLCMNGRWLNTPSDHTRVILSLCKSYYMVDGIHIVDDYLELYFDDSRSIGKGIVEWINNKYTLQYHIVTHGIDLLTTTMDPLTFIANIKCRHSNTITLEFLLLDTKFTSSIGNYLKSEILYHSRLSPFRVLKDCTDQELINLYNIAIYITKKSYHMKGFTMKDYLRPSGEHGQYICDVYGREGQYTPDGYQIIRTKTKGNRSTYWVPNIQT